MAGEASGVLNRFLPGLTEQVGGELVFPSVLEAVNALTQKGCQPTP